jgi:CRP-like cAMP-binding protein
MSPPQGCYFVLTHVEATVSTRMPEGHRLTLYGEASRTVRLHNRLLASLSSANQENLLLNANEIALPLRSVQYREYATPKYAYFPVSAVLSVVVLTASGQSAEVGLIGREGVVGAHHLIGPMKIPMRCFTQIEGTCLRIPYSDLQKAYQTVPEIRWRILEFIQGDLLAISQTAGCNRMHDVEPRLARWLLMVAARHGSNELRLTQETIAEMIGVRRTTITMVAGKLRQRGLIDYSRGHVQIHNRSELEKAACDCYWITNQIFNDLYIHEP